MKHRQVVVYLSKSLKTEESVLKPIRTILKSYGFKVTEYNRGEVYSPEKLFKSDFVYFVPNEAINTELKSKNSKNVYSFSCAKGQLEEAFRCQALNKPTFTHHYIVNNDLMMSKHVGEEFRSYSHEQTGTNWKKDYGLIRSYSFSPVTKLYPFIEGHLDLVKNPYCNYIQSNTDLNLLLLK